MTWKEYWKMTKWEWFIDGFQNISYALDCYNDGDKYGYGDFWNSINEGQTQMVEDDKWMTYFGAKPETMYVSQKNYDTLVEKINNPDPEQIESLRKLMNRKSPWDE